MNNFDRIFFTRYIGSADEIKHVFHRHVFIVLEDIILWSFFGLMIPSFLYYYDAFGLKTNLSFLQVSGWMVMIYSILLYKLCDWYYDVWIATEKSMIDVRWSWFTSNLLYIPYEKIEGVEIRTRSIFHAFIGMSDVIIKLAGDDRFVLTAAAHSEDIVMYIQGIGDRKKKNKEKDREPFEILVDTLSDVVKGQIATRDKEYITREYIEQLDTTLEEDDAIDLRRSEEKQEIESWKKRHKKNEENESPPESETSH